MSNSDEKVKNATSTLREDLESSDESDSDDDKSLQSFGWILW